MIQEKKIAFIGAGYMGSALIRGLAAAGVLSSPQNITASDLDGEALNILKDDLDIKITDSNSTAVATADVVMLCVKPQIIDKVLHSLQNRIGDRKTVISIAAGVSTHQIETRLSPGSRVIRAMPNMPALEGESATAICAGKHATTDDTNLARALFNCVGETVIVDESQMDAVTGLSGSGPAFVFLFLEAMIDAGVRVGLARNVARTLAQQTLLGSAKLVKSTGENPSALKDRITSPGGTTIAGLALLEERGFKGTVIRGVEAAVARSKELGQDNNKG